MKKHDIEVLVPELRDKTVHKCLQVNALIIALTEKQKFMLVDIVVRKLTLYYNHDFIGFGDLSKSREKLDIWIKCLSDITTRSLFAGLFYCLRGKTAYIDRPPSNPIAFRNVCLLATFPAFYFEDVNQVRAHVKSDIDILMEEEMKKYAGKSREETIELCKQQFRSFVKSTRIT